MARAARQPIRLKRVYDPAEPGDGQRLLVDGVWPRGKTKQELAIEAWLRSLAPSAGLRRWFGHDPARWEDFRARYFVGPEESASHPRAGTVGCDPAVMSEINAPSIQAQKAAIQRISQRRL